MRAGDLVNFYSTVVSFQKDYKDRNPGLVLAAEAPKEGSTSMSYDRGSAYVLWNTGEITCEHLSYLEVIEDHDERLLSV